MTVQYLIDSENVGDFWIPLLELPGQDTELIVFYTRNSPHMSYDSLIRLKESDRTVTFIKCYEGTNALDFQLVSELGYRISKDEDGSFIIVTNDTGFDAAVKYWRRRKKSVKRITGKECRNLERRLREDLSNGISQTHSAEESSGRLITHIEHDEDQDVQTEAARTETEADHEARPSGPNLRDAERAAQPDPEEGFTEYPDDMPDEEFDDAESEEADPYAYDLDAEEEEAGVNEDEEDIIPDESAYDIGPEETGDDTEESYVSEDDFDAEPDREMSLETDSVDEAITSGTDEEYVPDDIQPGENSEDQAESDGITDDLPYDGDGIVQESATDGETDQGISLGDATEELLPALPEKEAVRQTVDSPYPDPVPADSEKAPSAAEKEAEEEAAGLSKTADADQNAAVMEDLSVQSDEEPAAETPHRSKSRRSRSRRSKSSSRKQEQGSAQDSIESADADDSGLTREAAAGQDEPAAESDSRKGDAARDDTEAVRDKSTDQLPAPGDDEIARIVACIGAENLAELHNQLATFYGDQGKDIYLSIKNNTRSIPVLKPDLKQKFEYYCEIIFYRSDYSGEYPSDISEYLLNVREKLNNLNSLRYALQKHYGKEKGRRFYFLLKPFAKTMYQM